MAAAATRQTLGKLEKLYLLVAVAILSWLPVNCHLVGYDCSDARIVSRSPISDFIPSCELDSASTLQYEMEATLVYRNSSLKKTIARECVVRYNESSAGASPFMSAWTYESIDRDTCLKAHETEKLNLHGQIVDLDVGTTKRRIHGEAQIRDYEITLKTHLVSVQEVFNLLRIENTDVWCNYDDFECDFKGGKLFWEEENCRARYTPFFTTGRFEMVLLPGGRLFAVADLEDGQVAFELSELHYLVCSRGLAYRTTNWHWQIVIRKLGNLVHQVSRADLDVGRFEDAVYPQEGQKDSAFNVVQKLCEAQRAQAIATIQRVREASVWESAKQGLVGEISGDDLVVKQCLPVEVRVRPTDEDECYGQKLPIFDHLGREKFLCARSRIIVDNAVTIPCSREPLKPPTVVPTSEFEDFLTFVTSVGCHSAGLWTIRLISGIAFEFWWTKISTMIWGVQPEQVQRTNDSKLRRFARWLTSIIDSFFVLIRPPFY